MPFPSEINNMIPKPFEEKFSLLFGKDYEKMISIKITDIRKAIRTNTIKITKEDLVNRLKWKTEQVPWFDDGMFVSATNLASTLEYYLGYYYIQDAASMIPPLLLDAKEEDIVLDMTAAPGSKTTQIAAMMNNKGVIIANDSELRRLRALRFNLQRCGISNTIITNLDGRWIWQMGIKFDKILVDAPCSSSGTFVSNPNVFRSWSQSKVNYHSRLQKQLLESASKCISDSGEIVYSTCSLDPEENEEVIDDAVNRLGLAVVKAEVKGLKYRHGFTSFKNRDYAKEVKHAIRILPQDNLTDGFFICKLKRC